MADWTDLAACKDKPQDWFFPCLHGEQTVDERHDLAKAVCAGCHVRNVCLEEALERREIYGVWGGMTFTERKQEMGRRARARRKVA